MQSPPLIVWIPGGYFHYYGQYIGAAVMTPYFAPPVEFWPHISWCKVWILTPLFPKWEKLLDFFLVMALKWRFWLIFACMCQNFTKLSWKCGILTPILGENVEFWPPILEKKSYVEDRVQAFQGAYLPFSRTSAPPGHLVLNGCAYTKWL